MYSFDSVSPIHCVLIIPRPHPKFRSDRSRSGDVPRRTEVVQFVWFEKGWSPETLYDMDRQSEERVGEVTYCRQVENLNSTLQWRSLFGKVWTVEVIVVAFSER